MVWGHKRFIGSFNMGALSFSHTEGGVGKQFPLFKKKGGGTKCFTPTNRVGGGGGLAE